jgi:hypothetical protein
MFTGSSSSSSARAEDRGQLYVGTQTAIKDAIARIVYLSDTQLKCEDSFGTFMSKKNAADSKKDGSEVPPVGSDNTFQECCKELYGIKPEGSHIATLRAMESCILSENNIYKQVLSNSSSSSASSSSASDPSIINYTQDRPSPYLVCGIKYIERSSLRNLVESSIEYKKISKGPTPCVYGFQDNKLPHEFLSYGAVIATAGHIFDPAGKRIAVGSFDGNTFKNQTFWWLSPIDVNEPISIADQEFWTAMGFPTISSMIITKGLASAKIQLTENKKTTEYEKRLNVGYTTIQPFIDGVDPFGGNFEKNTKIKQYIDNGTVSDETKENIKKLILSKEVCGDSLIAICAALFLGKRGDLGFVSTSDNVLAMTCRLLGVGTIVVSTYEVEKVQKILEVSKLIEPIITEKGKRKRDASNTSSSSPAKKSRKEESIELESGHQAVFYPGINFGTPITLKDIERINMGQKQKFYDDLTVHNEQVTNSLKNLSGKKIYTAGYEILDSAKDQLIMCLKNAHDRFASTLETIHENIGDMDVETFRQLCENGKFKRVIGINGKLAQTVKYIFSPIFGDLGDPLRILLGTKTLGEWGFANKSANQTGSGYANLYYEFIMKSHHSEYVDPALDLYATFEFYANAENIIENTQGLLLSTNDYINDFFDFAYPYLQYLGTNGNVINVQLLYAHFLKFQTNIGSGPSSPTEVPWSNDEFAVQYYIIYGMYDKAYEHVQKLMLDRAKYEQYEKQLSQLEMAVQHNVEVAKYALSGIQLMLTKIRSLSTSSASSASSASSVSSESSISKRSSRTSSINSADKVADTSARTVAGQSPAPAGQSSSSSSPAAINVSSPEIPMATEIKRKRKSRKALQRKTRKTRRNRKN